MCKCLKFFTLLEFALDRQETALEAWQPKITGKVLDFVCCVSQLSDIFGCDP